MTPELRKALEDKLEALLSMLAYEPYLVDDNDRATIKLLTDALTVMQLDRIAYHLENGQIAIIQS